jgi:hypothetical protein
MKQYSAVSIKDLKTHKELDYINSVWYAIMNMDSFALLNLLSDRITYQDVSKQEFVNKLNDRFNNYKTLGDSELRMDFDYCRSCNCNKPVCKFIGNHSKKHFALFFEIHKGRITDIYHCNWYGDVDLLDTF